MAGSRSLALSARRSRARTWGSFLVVGGVVLAIPSEGRSAPPAPATPETISPSSPGEVLDDDARKPATEAQIALSSRGVVGAWLALGPFKVGSKASPLDAIPVGLGASDDRNLIATANDTVGGDRDLGKGRRPPARWTIISSGPPVTTSGAGQDPGAEGARSIDVKATLEDATGSELIAYAAGRLHLEKKGRYLLLLSVDDGVRVSVDGKVVFSRDDARPLRNDDDIIPLDLDAGDHDVVLKLHQRDGAWVFRAKLVEADDLSPPLGSFLRLAGTTATDAAALAARMSWLIVDRSFDAKSSLYRPILTVRYPEGAPRGVSIPVSAKLTAPASGGGPLFDVRAGGIAATARGVSDLVVSLPPVAPWSGTATLECDVAGRVVRSTFASRPDSERALARVARALEKVRGDEPWLVSGSLDSVRFLTQRLEHLIARGDGDAEAQVEEAKELDRLAANLERETDPYANRSGMMRRALVTPFDGAPSEFALYVPPSFKRGESRRYPLIVGLHGMNSYPISMMRALFGLDEEKKEPIYKDRRPLPAPAIDAFVIAPYAHGNTMYREIGEDDVRFLMSWAEATFPIDEARVTITGPSMGGIGSASLPLHYPHVFAAAEPLCGYHSYLIRADIGPRAKRPWERLLLEERSNVFWAENGEHLPLYIVHGTRDLPEANSYVLIDRYEKLNYSVKHEHPDAGHNVWGPTYGELKGIKWLLSQRLDLHPSHVRFRTMRTRYGQSAWVTIDALSANWGEVDARVKSRSAVHVTTSGVSAITLRRDDKLLDQQGAISVTIDGTTLSFEDGEPLVMHRASTWERGPLEAPGAKASRKRGSVTGPIRDVFHDPLLFVYAASAEERRAAEEVARAYANPPGVTASYPVMSDEEFLARGEALANERSLFLVGRTNRLVAALEIAANNQRSPFPIKIDDTGVTIGKEKIAGREVGAAFVYPNPMRPDRAVVIVAGVDTAGLLRAKSLPALLPDFVVWDDKIAPARGQLLLGSATVRAGGLFRNDWSLPPSTRDPMGRATQGVNAPQPVDEASD